MKTPPTKSQMMVFKGSREWCESNTWISTSLHRPDRGNEGDKIIRKNPTWKLNE